MEVNKPLGSSGMCLRPSSSDKKVNGHMKEPRSNQNIVLQYNMQNEHALEA